MRTAPALLLALVAATCTMPVRADEAALAARVDKLSAELEALKAELRQLKTQSSVPPAAVTQAAGVAPATTAGTPPLKPEVANDTGAQTPLPFAMAPGSPFAGASADAPATTFFGYGELNYANYPRNRSQTQADLTRAVIGIGHRFDDRTRFVAEFEWEHAVTSADDQGESEVEQFYVERSFTSQIAGRAGLFLIPSGILNTAHEPTQFFGVTRNFVETAIIPTTWREGGLGVTGITDFDLT